MKNKINLIEETNRMRDLFGYKAGKVISEQEINSSKYLNEEDNDDDYSNNSDYIEVNKKVKSYERKPEIAIPGISRAAVDKILAFSKENKSRYTGSYLFPPQQSAIDGEFGAGTYNRFFYGGGEDVLKGNKIFKQPSVDDSSTKPQGFLALKAASDANKKVNPAAVKPVVNPPIPKELVDINGVEKFQEWLNTQDPTWVNGKPLELNKERGYGRFGPLTSASWNKLKDIYLKEIGSLQANQKVVANPELATTKVAPAQAAKIGQTAAPVTPVSAPAAGLTADQQTNLNRIGQQLQTPEQKRAAELAQKYGRK